MPIEILMPALSPTMTEGNLSKWLKKEGDKVSPGDVIAEIETDKATMEVEAVDEGILAKILIPSGTEAVAVNKLIGIIIEEDEDISSIEGYKDKAEKFASEEEQSEIEKKPEKSVESNYNVKSYFDENRIKASPLAKKIAYNEAIDLTRIKGTGPHGRIIKEDVIQAINNKSSSDNNFFTNPTFNKNNENYKKIQNSSMRKIIAKRLCESKQSVPHFYLNIECNLDNLIAIRASMNEAAKDLATYKLSVNDFIIKAVAMALKNVPEANSSWNDEAILQYNNVDIAVAVAVDGGLITPIIKNADVKTLSIISNEMKDLASRAKINKLTPEEFQGGGFTISNLGMYGIKNFNAIINPPQSCILAVGAGCEKVVVKNGQMVISNVMEVTLSSDHRVVDGAVGANFLNYFKKFIENPVLMLA